MKLTTDSLIKHLKPACPIPGGAGQIGKPWGGKPGIGKPGVSQPGKPGVGQPGKPFGGKDELKLGAGAPAPTSVGEYNKRLEVRPDLRMHAQP